MATKADFSGDEWEAIIQGPMGAGLTVMIADGGGRSRESAAIAGIYAEARESALTTGLLTEIVVDQPAIDAPRTGVAKELERDYLGRLRTAIALLRERATEQEVENYQEFTMLVADRVARAHKEGFLRQAGEEASVDELAAVARVRVAIA